MEKFKKKNIVIGIALFLVMIGSLGYSLLNNKNEPTQAAQVNDTEVVDETMLVIDEAGSITLDDKYEKVIINVPGVQIEDGSVENILVTEGVGDGDVTLLNVISEELTLQGGGPNSVMIAGNSEIQSVYLERKNGPLAVRVKDTSLVKYARVSDGSKDVTLAGKFTDVEIEASDIKVEVEESVIDTFSLIGKELTVSVDGKTKIGSAIILANSENNKITFNSNIENVILDGKNNSIDFNGKVGTVYVRDGADNAIINISDTSVVEAFITSVPLVLNGEGQVNQIVSDSESDITGTFQIKKTARLADVKKTTVNKSRRNTSSTRQVNKKLKSPQLTKAEKTGKPGIVGGKLETIRPNRPSLKPTPTPDKPGLNPDKPGLNPDEPGLNSDKPGPNPDEPGMKPDDPKSESNLTAKEMLEKNLDYLYQTIKNPGMGSIGGDWSILSLARGDYNIPEAYVDKYYENIETEVSKLMKKHNGKLDRNKGSEHSRLILGLSALGKDITNVAGYDIREGLADFKFATRQGINGPIFALIALDSYEYEIPQTKDSTNQSTRQRFIDYILDKEITQDSGEVGGWALYGNNPNADITGMAIQALTPYYEEQKEVKDAINRALDWLSKEQNANGGYSSGWEGETLESAAQVVVALTGLDIDPHTDSDFIKNGNSLIDNLLSYSIADGGFAHVQPANQVDLMATEQGTYALVAYDRFINDQNRLYDMTDVAVAKDALAELKLDAISSLKTYKDLGDYQENKKLLEKAITNGISKINKATTIQEVEEAVKAAQTEIDGIKTDSELQADKLLKQKEDAKTKLKSYKNSSDYTENSEKLAQAINDGKVAIDQASTFEEITAALTRAQAAIDEIKTDKEIEEENNSKLENNERAKELLRPNLDYIYETEINPRLGLGEWSILALARGGYDIPEDYNELYYSNVTAEVAKRMEENNGKLHAHNSTEHSRLILGLTSVGRDVSDVAGYDIREGLADFDYLTKQGINGLIYALISLDTFNYEIPNAEVAENQTTRDRLIEEILNEEMTSADGELRGWAFTGNKPDPDITAMTLQALAPYQDRAEVKAATERGLNWLSEVQNDEGGFNAWGTGNSPSVAQVIIALTELGIDPHNDPRFIKNGQSAVDNLLTFAVETGGFSYHKPATRPMAMATGQGTAALVAYNRFVNDDKRFYDMTDVEINIKSLDEIKNEAKLELENYKEASDYTTNAEEFAKAIADGKEAIDQATTTQEVEEAVKAAQAEIDGIKTDSELEAEKLLEQKEEAESKLKSYKNPNDYTENSEELAQAINDGITEINKATTSNQVAQALAVAKAALDQIQSDAELEPELPTESVVYVTVENTTFTKEDGAPWFGQLLDKYEVMIDEDTSMMDAVTIALKENKIEASGMESNYISEINGLSEFDGGPMSGWMGTLNEVFPSFGFQDVELDDQDEIRIMYTVELGQDLEDFGGWQ